MSKIKTVKFVDKLGIQDFYRKNSTDVGYDIRSSVTIDLYPGQIKIIPTGLYLKCIEEGYGFDIRSRSGLASKGVIVLNAPGTIDPSYKDEIKVILMNCGEYVFPIKRGDRIAQLLIKEITYGFFEEVDEEEFEKLFSSDRRGGFGSSGIK